MKNSAIMGIFYEGRGYVDNIKPALEDKDNIEFLEKTRQELTKNLTPEQVVLFNNYVDKLVDTNYIETGYYFTEGFKLGLKTGIECSND